MFELRFFEIYRSEEYLLLLIEGIGVSTALTIGAGAMGITLEIILAAQKYRKLPALIGFVWPFWFHALLALTINFSGYFAEILRSGYASTAVGQLEAAISLNLSRTLTFFKVILPQTIIKMFPSLSSQFIFIFLTTGVISEIGVTDLTHAGIFIDSRTFRSFEVFITLSIIYIVLALILKAVVEIIFRKTLGNRS